MSVRGDFTEVSGITHSGFQETTTSTIHAYAELEAKILTSDENDFQRLISGLRDKGILQEAERTKMLYSSYFDRTDFALEENGLGLRMRYEEEPETGQPILPDLSSKTLGEDFGDGTRRTEIESDLPEDRLELNPYLLMKEHGGDALARDHIEDLLESMNYAPQDLREVFFIDCTRTNFKISLYVVPDEENRTDNVTTYKIKTRDQLNGDASRAKHAVFEFSLDQSRFNAPGKDSNIYLGSDNEIEFEVMTGEGCKYDPNPMASDPELTETEAEAAQQYIFRMIYNILDPANFTINSHSKQERGMARRRDHEVNNQCEIGFMDRATRRGGNDISIPHNCKGWHEPRNKSGNSPQPDPL